MSHAYYLRPNAKGRLQRRLNAHVAAFGPQNQDKIIAKPSETGQGVHLYFDPERSLSPGPDQTAETEHHDADSTEDVIVVDDESDGSADSSSGLASDLDTIAPDTPSPRGSFHPSSQLRAPKAPRLGKPRYWRAGSVASTASVQDSMAMIAERRQQALANHLDGGVRRRHHFFDQQRRAEEDLHRQPHEGESDEQRRAIMLREYEEGNEKWRRENAPMFNSDEVSVMEYLSRAGSPVYSEFGESLREFTPPPLPLSAPGPSRLALRVQEDRALQPRALRRHNAEQDITAQRRDEDPANTAAEENFVVVARRVPMLGPSGTVIIDHDTDEQMLVTKRYRVRAEELQSIDGDGDSVMGDD